MTTEDADFARNNHQLKLSRKAHWTHFQIVYIFLFFALFIPFIKLFHYLKGTHKSFSKTEFISILIFIVLALLLYVLQKRRLRFKTVDTNLTREELLMIIKEVAEKLKWLPYNTQNDYIVARTRPSFFSGSWGEQITIVFDQTTVLVNSICDPRQKSSIISVGRNRKNMNTLIKAIKESGR